MSWGQPWGGDAQDGAAEEGKRRKLSWGDDSQDAAPGVASQDAAQSFASQVAFAKAAAFAPAFAAPGIAPPSFAAPAWPPLQAGPVPAGPVAAEPLEICPFFANGSCGFGDRCNKSHGGPQPPSEEVCQFFLKGFCGFGDACFRKHVEPEKKEPCKWFQQGKCTFGDKCFNAHVKKEKKEEDWGGWGSKKSTRDDISVQVEIPAKRVKDVMGVHGNNIRKIQQMSGVYKIKILDEDSKTKAPEEIVVVEVRGNAPAVEMAHKMILAVAEGDQSCIGNIEESIEVEPRLVSKIIGTGGEVIQQMQKQTGTRLTVRSGERGTNQLPKLIMIGTPENVAKARNMVENYIKMASDRATQDTHIDAADISPEDEIPWPWLRPQAGADPAELAASAASQTMAAGAMDPAMTMPGFEEATAAAMAYAQSMAAMSMQQMMLAQAQMMAQATEAAAPAVAVTSAPQAAAVSTGSAKLATSLRDKLLANRKRANPDAE